MKAQYDITIDLTKGQEEFWRQIDEIDNILKPKPLPQDEAGIQPG